MSKPPKIGVTDQEAAAISYRLRYPDATLLDAFDHAYPKAGTLPLKRRHELKTKLWARPRVKRAYRKALETREHKALSRRDRLIRELEKLAYTDLPGIVDYEAGTLALADFQDLNAAQRACIKDFKVRTKKELQDKERVPISEVEVKLYSKQDALNSLAKIHEMYKTQVEHSGTITTTQDPAQALASLLEQATDEERAVIEAMAERLTGAALPSQAPPSVSSPDPEDEEAPEDNAAETGEQDATEQPEDNDNDDGQAEDQE